MKENSLNKTFFEKSVFFQKLSIYTRGGVIAKIISLLVFLYIVKILTITQFAQFAIYLIIVDLLTVIVGLGLTSTMLRIEGMDKKTILSNSLVLLVLSSFIIAFILLSGFQYLIETIGGNYIFLKEYELIIIVASIVKSFVSLLRGFLVYTENPKVYIKLNIFMEVVFFITIVVTSLSLTQGEADILRYVIILQTLSILLASIYGISLILESLSIDKISIKVIKTILFKSWAYMLKNIIGVMQMEASKIILSIVSTSAILGVYSFYSLAVNKMSFIVGMFDKAYIPKIKKLYASREQDKMEHAHYLVNKVSKVYAYACLLLITFIAFIFVSISNNESLFVFLQQEYINYLDLFYLIIFSWLIGNFRSFYDVWQYMDRKSVGTRLVTAHIIVLVLLYYGGLTFYSYFDVYGLVYNQILVTLLYLLFSLYNYRKFCFSRLG